MSEVSVVIVSRNARERLRDCLESLKHALPLSSEVIVVDNASTDGTSRMVTTEFEHARLIRNEQDVGLGGIEQAVKLARGAYLLLLDPRIQLYPNAAREMIDYLEQNLRHGAVVPRLVRPDDRTVAAHQRLPTLRHALWLGTPVEKWRRGRTVLRRIFACDFDYSHDGDVQLTSTSCILMRRKALKRAEIHDLSLWPHFHEADYCMRLRQAGWRLGYLANTPALDVDGIAERRYPDLSPAWHSQRLAWYRKHLGQTAGWWVKACVGWTVSVRLAKELRRRINGLYKEPIVPVWREYAGLLRR